jgi:hypothetical protein
MSSITPKTGDRVRFLVNYPANGSHARKGDEGTVTGVRASAYGSPLLDIDLDGKGRIPAAYARRVEVIPAAAPVEVPTFAVGDEVRVETPRFRTGGGVHVHTHHDASRLVGKVGQVHGGPDSDGDLDVEFPDGRLDSFDPAGLVKVEPAPVAKPVPGTVYRVVSTGATSGLRHWYDIGSLVLAVEGTVPSCYAKHEDAGEFRLGIDGSGKRQTVRLADLKVHVPEPVALPVEVGGRYVVESPIFHRPGGEYGDHSVNHYGTRPKVGEVVTLSAIEGYLGDAETTTGWRIAPEGLVPAPKFLPGDRVSIVSSTYVGTYRKAGNVGTVVEMPRDRLFISGISNPAYAVTPDGEPRKVWGYRETELALLTVEPAPAYKPAEGDRVKVVGVDFMRGSDSIGKFGEVLSGPDADGDFRVRLVGGEVNYFAPDALAKAPVEAPTFAVGDRVKIVANILPSGKPGNLGETIVGGEHTVTRVGEDRGQKYVIAGWRLAPESFEKVEAPEVKGAEPTLVVVDETAAWTEATYAIPSRFVAGVEAKPEDYALRLEVSAKAADILVKAGYRGVLGSDVAALGEFLLGIEKRQA